jgi:hypothetical protein
MHAQDSPEHPGAGALDELCEAVASETGIPPGRVKKVLVAAQRLQRVGPPVSPAAVPPVSQDPLRFYPLGANGRIHPPLPQPRAADADTPA